MKQVQWFDQHYYKVITPDGELFLPSVTTILSILPRPYLAQWRGNIGNDVADQISFEAKTKGSNIHKACSVIATGGIVYNADPINGGLDNNEITELSKYRKIMPIYSQYEYLQIYRFVQLIEQLNAKIVKSEDIVYNITEGYAGTLDLILKIESGKYKINGSKPVDIEGGLYIADIKTGKTIPDEIWMQLAAYKQCLAGMDFAGAMCIHTNSTTKSAIEGLTVKIRSSDELVKDYDNFLQVYRTWKINPTVSAPKIFNMPAYLQLSVITKTNEQEN